MLEQLIDEANRQFTLCNACRYCEGLCSVFPAMEMRSAFAAGDIAYLANLCHDCRACLDVCPFSAPHEYAIDIPALMSAARAESFEQLATPRAAWRLLTHPWAAPAAFLLALAFYAVVALVTGDASRIVRSHDERSSFYHVVGYLWIVVPFSVLAIAATVAMAAGVARFARGAGGVRRVLLPGRAHARAAASALTLTNLRGGGGGCHYPGDTVSRVRTRLHHLVFYGFALMFCSTVSAAVAQELIGNDPPYPLLSAPVVLGSAGGIATLAGGAGFLLLGARTSDPRKTDDARRLDRLFTTMLLAAVATGLLTLTLRSTAAMGPLLVIHLGTVGAFFASLPFGKFVHGVYRYLALLRSELEAEPDRATAAPSP